MRALSPPADSSECAALHRAQEANLGNRDPLGHSKCRFNHKGSPRRDQRSIGLDHAGESVVTGTGSPHDLQILLFPPTLRLRLSHLQPRKKEGGG